MGFKKKTDTGLSEMVKFETEGDSLTGYYIDSVDHDGDYGVTKKHIFQTDKGMRVVFGQKHLTTLLEGVDKGVLVRATFESRKKGKKGNPMKMFTLEIDDEQRIDANEVNDSAVYDEADDAVNYDAPTAPATSAPRANAPTAAQQARTKALLSGKNRLS